MTKAATKERGPDLLEQVAEPPPAGKLPATRPPKAKPGAISKMEAPGEASENFLAVIIRAASDPATDVGKVRELLAMKKQLEDERKVQEYAEAMHTAQGLMPKIVKDKENKETHSKYPSLENVSKSIDAIARQHGFTHSYGSDDSKIANHYRIVCDLTHINGHTRRYHLDLPADATGQKGNRNKSEVHAVVSTTSYGRRVVKVLIWDLIIVDSDVDGNRPKNAAPDKIVGKITPKQVETLKSAIDFADAKPNAFCKVYEIAKLEDLGADLFDHALKDLAALKAQNEKKSG